MAVSFTTVMPVLAAEDVDRAVTFYRDKLGCEIRDFPQDPMSKFVHIGDSWLLIYKSGYQRGETTVASIAVSDVEQAVKELRDRGVKFEDYDMPGLKTENGIATLEDMQSAWFKDTEGNTIALVTDNAQLRQLLQAA
jgi:predicted enzyme related to lactoylglutathione lyase